jgi:membrane protease YdiL (CAAX protease family)
MFGFSPKFLDAGMLARVKLFIHNLLLFLLLVTAFSTLGMGVIYGMGYMMGVDIAELHKLNEYNSPNIRNTIRLMTMVTHCSYFILPALTITYIQHGDNWRTIFLFKKKVTLPILIVSIAVIVLSFPLVQYLYKFNASLHIPADWAIADRNTTAKISQLMKMHSPLEFLLNLLVIGIIPAIGEEMLFRGLIQQCLAHYTKSHTIAIIVGAIIFSAIHFQFLGFLPRCMMGILLGYIFYYTKNLWYSIIAHAFFNSMQVMNLYYKQEEIIQLNPTLKTDIDFRLVMCSLIGTLLMIFILKRKVKIIA